MYENNNIFIVKLANWSDLREALLSGQDYLNDKLYSDEEYSIKRQRDHKRLFFYMSATMQLGSDLTPDEFAEFFIKAPSHIQANLKRFVLHGYVQPTDILTLIPNQMASTNNSLSCEKHDFTKNTSGFMQHTVTSLQAVNSLFFYHNHLDISSYLIFAENMAAFKQAGVEEFLIEFPAGETSLLLALFNRTGDEQYWQLIEEQYQTVAPEAIYGFRQLSIAAQKHGVKLIAVDDAAPKERLSLAQENELMDRRNQIMASHAIARIQRLASGKKVIGLFGSSHYEITRLISELSDNNYTSASYAIVAEQFFDRDLYYLRQEINLFKNSEYCEYSAKIPNLINQKAALLSLQKSLRCSNYMHQASNMLDAVKRCCLFPCEVIQKQFDNDDIKNKQISAYKMV